MKLKHCGPCGLDKPATLEFFNRNRAKPDGLSTECKLCSCAASTARYAKLHVQINAAKKSYWATRYQRQKQLRQATRATDPITTLTDTELAYLAGLIDGEGSFGVAAVRTACRYVPVMSLSMTCERTMQWFGEKVGVGLNQVSRKKPSWRDQFKLRLCGQRLILFCSLALPFFVTKKEQAEEILRFGETYIPQKGGCRPHPEWVFAKRAAIKNRIHRLNRPHVYGLIQPYTSVAGEPPLR